MLQVSCSKFSQLSNTENAVRLKQRPTKHAAAYTVFSVVKNKGHNLH